MMLMLSAASTGCILPAAAPEELWSTKRGHVGTVPRFQLRPHFTGSRPVQSASSNTFYDGCRGRRGFLCVTALPTTSPSADSADVQQVWHLVQRVWQDLLDVTGSQAPSDASAALALQHTGAIAQQTLLMLYLLHFSCSAA